MAPARRMTHSNREVYPIMFLSIHNIFVIIAHNFFLFEESEYSINEKIFYMRKYENMKE